MQPVQVGILQQLGSRTFARTGRRYLAVGIGKNLAKVAHLPASIAHPKMGKQFLLESCGTAFARFPELSDFRFIPLNLRLQSCQPLRPCLFPTPQFRFLKLAFSYQRVPCRSIRSGRPQVVPTCLVGFHTGF